MCTVLLKLASNGGGVLKIRAPARFLSAFSTKVVPKEDDDSTSKNGENQLKEFVKIPHIQPRTRIKKPQREPFVKNLLLGVFDAEILTYPEAVDKEDWIRLNKNLKPVEDYMNSQPDVALKKGRIPKEHLESLARLNMLGLQAPQLFDGQELSTTEMLRCNEVLANKSSSVGVVSNNYHGLNALVRLGNAKQQAKYLEKLVKGQAISAFCLQEVAVADHRHLKTKATLSADKTTWVLNGEKVSVINGESADLFVVFAYTDLIEEERSLSSNCTVFLVDRSSSGIVTKPCSTSGLENTDISDVEFQNVQVPQENVLGQVNEGEKVLETLLADVRLSAGPSCISLTKNVINDFVQYCKSADNLRLYETDAVASKLGEYVISLYAMESVTYLTTSLIDQYENQDCQLETAIVKVFNSDSCFRVASDCLQFLGSPAFMKDHWSNQYQRDALSHILTNEANDNLKLTIALLGLKYAGMKMNEKIKMLRNPLFYPTEMFKRMWTTRRQMEDRPKLSLKLHHYLHPSLIHAAEALEYCVLRTQFATECLLARYGPEVVDKHMELNRLAECLIDMYVGTAVLGRASRSYCIGLRNADMEMSIANAYCFKMKDKVQGKMLEIISGPYATNDATLKSIATRALETGRYFAEHPLEKNF